jgi:hypothetical protein
MSDKKPEIKINPAFINNHLVRKSKGNKFLIIGATALLIFLGILGLQQIDVIPKFGDWFKTKPLTIDQTPLIVQHVRELAEFTSITSEDEVVVNEFKKEDKNIVVALWENPSMDPNHKKLTLVVKGKIRVGMDLKEINPKDIRTNGDTIYMNLPAVKLLDVIVNPSDVKVFREKGKWSNEEVRQLTLKGKKKIEERAAKHKILARAEKKGKAVMESLLRNLGYKTIYVFVKK